MKIGGETIEGTERSGYLPARFAPFSCANCGYYTWPHFCKNRLVIADAEAGAKPLRLSPNKFAIVEPLACCSLWKSK